MTTINDVFVSNRTRAVRLCKRKDLSISQQHYRNEQFWVVKDPLEVEFYRLNDEEHAILKLVDGSRSLSQIKEEFEKQFPAQRITPRQLQAFISDLQSKSLLAYTDSDDAGTQLIDRARDKRIAKLKQRLSSILALKWRGVDPDRFLDRVTPYVGWMFSIPALVCGCLFMMSAALWLLVHFETFSARLPALGEFLHHRNWVLLALTIMGMKVLHELAHGICFKRFGGECHEIGVMLMLLIPTLYCSTTDSWLIPNKWKRAAIGAAGIYIELMIASCATFGWWFSETGTFNMLCLNIMATGSISAVLINANPFLKYDGYYIFSDVMELPNLRERAGKMTQSYFLKYGLGVDEDAEPNCRRDTRLTLVAYKLSSFAMRVVIIVLIKFMLIDRLRAIGLSYFGLAIGLMAIGMLLIPPLWGLFKFFKIPGRLNRIEMKKLALTSLIASLLLFVFFAVPFPRYVKCPLTIQPRGGRTIYVRHDAVLKDVFVKPGELVEEGQRIAKLDNLDTRVTLAKYRTQKLELSSELKMLELNRAPSAATAARIETLKVAIATNDASVREYETILESYDIVAPRSGHVVPEWINPTLGGNEMLESWDGSPLSEVNRGTWLTSGQKICTVCDLAEYDAVLLVSEHDISFVRKDSNVTMMLDSHAGKRIRGTVATLASKQSDELPRSLSKKSGGSIQLHRPTKVMKSSTQPSDEHFEARVPLPPLPAQLSTGLRGQARIRVQPLTLFQRLILSTHRRFRKVL